MTFSTDQSVFHLNDITVGAALVRLIILRVSQQHTVHIRACILEQFVGAVEDDQRNLAVAQHTQLVCFLHETEFTLCECHLHATRNIRLPLHKPGM